jgi:hypothetical protein
MTYAIVYVENGDFVADFETRDEARAALRKFVVEHPDTHEQVGLMAFDDDGHPASDFQLARTAKRGWSREELYDRRGRGG